MLYVPYTTCMEYTTVSVCVYAMHVLSALKIGYGLSVVCVVCVACVCCVVWVVCCMCCVRWL